MKVVNALRARSRLGTILDEVSQEGEHYIIERLKKPLVAVLPFDEYQKRIVGSDQTEKKREFFTAVLAFRAKTGGLAKGKESTKIIRKMRERRK